MVSNDERMRVLRMVDEGKITADQGAQLISALGGDVGSQRPYVDAGAGDGSLRVVVTDLQSGRARVNVRVPARLMDLALHFGSRFVPQSSGVDLEELMDAVHAGATGKVVDVIDHDGGQRVEVFIE